MLVGALVARTVVGVTCRLLPLPLRYLRFLLNLRQGVETVSGEPERLRYSEVAEMLGE